MIKNFTLVLFVIFLLPQALRAEVTVNAIFSDHMVLQRDTKVPVWGWADPKEAITVSGSWGKTASVLTSPEGKWRVDLETPSAGGPFTITISGKNTIVIHDVLSGEVWLCTGQSNMDFSISKFLNDSKDPKHQPLVAYIRNEAATVNDPYLRHIEVPQATSLFDKEVNFEGNWRKATTDEIGKITATGYFFAKELRKQLNVPIGLVECSWGGTRVQPWISEASYLEDENLRDYFLANRKEEKTLISKMDAEDYQDTEYNEQMEHWKSKGEKGKQPKPMTHPKEDRQAPGTLYNAMLHTIIPYKIKGAIWYQGESNAVYMPNEYEAFLTNMIRSWRADWGQGDFSFYMAQLAACTRGNDTADKGWATVNDHLRRTTKLPNTGLAVLYDIGEPRDIHPHNKMDAGKRLALWALEKDYNVKVPVYSGPLYKSKKVKKDKIIISFDHAKSGLMVGYKNLLDDTISVDEPLEWFEVLSSDGIWYKANATIISKNKVAVWNATVSEPLEVRYAWSGNPEGANLYNTGGLPAAAFSTED